MYKRGQYAWVPISQNHPTSIKKSRLQSLPNSHDACRTRLPEHALQKGPDYILRPFAEGLKCLAVEPAGSLVCPATPPAQETGLSPFSFPGWCCSLEPFRYLNLSFYGMRSHWEPLRRQETNCARFFQISMPGNPSSILLNTDPFLSLWKWDRFPQERPFLPTWTHMTTIPLSASTILWIW